MVKYHYHSTMKCIVQLKIFLMKILQALKVSEEECGIKVLDFSKNFGDSLEDGFTNVIDDGYLVLGILPQ